MMTENTGRFGARDLDMWVSDKHGAGGLTFQVKRHLHSETTPYQTIDVVDTAEFGRMLFLDGNIMISQRDEFIYHEAIAHVPLNCHLSPRTALVIGGGDGGALRELCRYGSIRRADLVEIDRAVIAAAEKYFPQTACAFASQKSHVIVEEGVRYLEGCASAYDVIISDSTDPYGPGEALFQQGAFKAIKRALKDDGLFAAQTESAFYDPETVKAVYGNLAAVFPFVTLFWAPVPTYPGGGWTFCLCGKNPDLNPLAPTQSPDHISAMGLKHYSHAWHKGAFYLPNYVREAVSDSLTWTAR